MKGRILVNTFGVGTLALLFGTSSPWAAQTPLLLIGSLSGESQFRE